MFTTKMHHQGCFSKAQGRMYRCGFVDFVDFVDIARFSMKGMGTKVVSFLGGIVGLSFIQWKRFKWATEKLV